MLPKKKILISLDRKVTCLNISYTLSKKKKGYTYINKFWKQSMEWIKKT